MTNDYPSITPLFWKMMLRLREDPSRWPARLEKFSEHYLKRFFWDYDYALAELNDDAFYLEMQAKYEGLSEDGSKDLAAWTIIQGQEFYERAFDDPSIVPSGLDFREIPEMGAYGQAMTEWHARHGTWDLPDPKADPHYGTRYGW